MYLKRIELQGFKSFADKTVIDVRQGITGIVGPNGSGKSNISDAIRWVMGEQSAKALRGGKMEDVIFNGTQKRKALGYAEVSMIFDNSTGFLPSEYAEVEITRRVFRSGESDYMINRNPCRLKDIHELFMDTGMGRDGYSIVGQGKIAEIVSQKGDERRSVFEEAAGISKYRYRKQEAERKLGHTEDNLTRVRDILSELEGRVEPLAHQSEKAIKYLNLREELKGIEVSALLEIIDQKKQQLSQTEQLYDAAAQQFEAVKANHEKANAESEMLFEKIKEADGEIEDLRAKLSEAESKGAALSNARALTLANIANAKDNIIRTQTELDGWSKRGEEIDKSIAAAEKELLLAKETESRLASEASEAESRLKEATAEMAKRNNDLEEAKLRVIDLGRKKSEAQTKIEGIDALNQSYRSRNYALDAEIAGATADLEKYKLDLAEAENKAEAAAEKVESVRAAMTAQNDEAAKINTAINQKKAQSNALVASLGEKTAKLNMLREMERGLEGYARSVRELVRDKENGKFNGKMIGVLSKLIKTDKEYITAVEIALGGAMQNIVVQNESDAKEAIEYLKRNRMGRVTFLPVSTQRGSRLDGEARILSSNGAVAVAADLVRCEDALKGVVESLLGRTLVVDTMDNAVKIAKEYHHRFKIVTLSGELLQPGGSITGGSINKSQALLQRGEEISALEKECARLEKESQKVEDEIDDLYDSFDDLKDAAEKEREKLSAAESSLNKISADMEMKRSLIKITVDRIEKTQIEKEELLSKTETANENKNRLNSILYGSDGLIATAEKTVASKQEGLKAATIAREEAHAALTDKKMEIAAAAKDTQTLSNRLSELQGQRESSSTDYELRLSQKKELEEKVILLGEALERNKAETQIQDELLNELRGRIDEKISGKSGTNRHLEDIRSEIKDLSDSMFAMQEEVVRLETRKSKIESEHENATNRLWDDYELTYNTALPHKTDIGSLSSAQKKIGELKGKIKALGNINVDSIDEYKAVKERYEFMTAQVNDLEEGKRNLEKLISEMMSVMKVQFAEKFKIINENFGKIFVDLFGGGHAGVRLSDPNDVLESGIEIEVQPPGKKLQSISLFSGGEHALTAIALLFALLKVSPSPFIVLDEIEAALDDENVYRFADYIKSYDETTQFVVITHRRGTMEAANILYGVTMQEKGVSKLLSMKLEDIAVNEE